MRWSAIVALVVVSAAGLLAMAVADPGKVEPEPLSPKVRSLLAERIALYKEAYESARQGHSAARLGFDQVVAAQSSLLQAELDLCETSAARVAVLEKLVTAAEQAVEMQKSLQERGSATYTETLHAKAKLVEAKIELESEGENHIFKFTR